MSKTRRILIPLCLLAGLLASACAKQPPESQEKAQAAAEPAAQSCVVNPPKETFACTMEYLPVCGCDGKTYSNACMAKAAGVPETRPGACEPETE